MIAVSKMEVTLAWFSHPKCRRMKAAFGAQGAYSILELWAYAAANKQDGVMHGMSKEDLAFAANWPDDNTAEKFIDTAIELKLIDRIDNGTMAIHGWYENQEFIANGKVISEEAAGRADKRWASERKKAKENAALIEKQANGNASRYALINHTISDQTRSDQIKPDQIRADDDPGPTDEALEIQRVEHESYFDNQETVTFEHGDVTCEHNPNIKPPDPDEEWRDEDGESI